MSGTIFVTGGAGYVGSHCCKAFAEAGWNVVVYDNLSRGWRDFVRWGPLIEGDLLDEARLKAAIAETRPGIVAHFAALIEVGESVRDPAVFYRTNVVGSLNLLNAMRAADVGRIVVSSTAAVYGRPECARIAEDHPLRPINPYGWSKHMLEQLLTDFEAAYGLRSVALRYFNAAGADGSGAIGERHRPETHLTPLAIRAALPGESALTIFGDDYDTPDGTAIRDYVHVSDLAEAHRLAVEHLSRGGASERLNLGTGRGVSVAELIDAVERATGAPCRASRGPRREGDPAMLVASSERAAEVLGWRAKRSGIEQIVADALAWERWERGGGAMTNGSRPDQASC